MNGWVKLYRSLVEWEWWDDENTMRLFIYCLIMANHEDVMWHGVVIPRGCFNTSIEQLRRAIGKKTTIQEARTAINHLISTGEITSKSTNRGSVITICNYEKYQSSEEEEQQANNKPINTQTTSNGEKEKEKEKKNPPITPYKENKNKKEKSEQEGKNINSSSLNNARAREEELAMGGVIGEVENLAEELKQEIRDGGSTAESAMRLYGIAPEQLEEYVGWFVDKLNLDGVSYKSRSDFRRHFNNWLRIQAQEIINKQQAHNGTTITNSRYQPQYSAEFLADIAAGLAGSPDDIR